MCVITCSAQHKTFDATETELAQCFPLSCPVWDHLIEESGKCVKKATSVETDTIMNNDGTFVSACPADSFKYKFTHHGSSGCYKKCPDGLITNTIDMTCDIPTKELDCLINDV